jgi:hypothetical protein
MNQLDGYVYPVLSCTPKNEYFYNQIRIYSSATGQCCAAVEWGYPMKVSNIAFSEQEDYRKNLKLDNKSWRWISRGL